MKHTTTSNEVQQPLYIDEKRALALCCMSRSTWRRHIMPRLTRYEFGPRCVRYRADEVNALLESMEAGAA